MIEALTAVEIIEVSSIIKKTTNVTEDASARSFTPVMYWVSFSQVVPPYSLVSLELRYDIWASDGLKDTGVSLAGRPAPASRVWASVESSVSVRVEENDIAEVSITTARCLTLSREIVELRIWRALKNRMPVKEGVGHRIGAFT